MTQKPAESHTHNEILQFRVFSSILSWHPDVKLPVQPVDGAGVVDSGLSGVIKHLFQRKHWYLNKSLKSDLKYIEEYFAFDIKESLKKYFNNRKKADISL